MHPTTETLIRKLYLPAAPLIRRLYRVLPERATLPLRLLAEKLRYSGVVQVHDLPPIAHYWSNTYLLPVLQRFGFGSGEAFYLQYLERICSAAASQHREAQLISLGAGNCDLEVRLAAELRMRGHENFHLECLDLNRDMLARGETLIREHELVGQVTTTLCDIGQWLPPAPYDAIVVNQFLHHVIDLEGLFASITAALRDDGFFLTSDMIGRNGHMRWPEALSMVERFWDELPAGYHYNHMHRRRYRRFRNWDCSVASSEGIRAQDILPLLMQRFGFDLFVAFANVIDIFIDRPYGPNFDPNRDWDRSFIDRVHAADQAAIEDGTITPTHIIAALTRRRDGQPRVYKHLTPEFCMRVPRT